MLTSANSKYATRKKTRMLSICLGKRVPTYLRSLLLLSILKVRVSGEAQIIGYLGGGVNSFSVKSFMAQLITLTATLP